ncbi:oligopeptide/dipeptide ABC transporter ATP-binding protein [Nonomuraea sp. NPDC000554]|uniref:oligopeptide/dipeptide ABC transporter ATP-binding protein n=1 Tax=Nonomuraea sp. NPDC000554 TaxID=3154259 RepID=UPI003317D745
MLLITHDLRVTFDFCDRVQVMYAGRVLESRPSKSLAADPGHPYTVGLISALPSVQRSTARLEGIPGSVPRAADVTDRCAFADRCEQRGDDCLTARPPLRPLAPDRQTACLYDVAPPVDREADIPPPAAGPVGAPPLLRVEALRKTYGKAVALDGVDLHIKEGERLGLVGESGSGKTTLARCLLGLATPDGGTIELHGGDPRQVQCVFQDPSTSLNPAMTVGAALAEAASMAGPKDRRPVVELLELVGLPASYARLRPAHVEEYAMVLRSETAVWSYEPRETLPRLAIAVRDRGQALGSIWVVLGERPLAPNAVDVLAEGARLAAPYLARFNLAADHDRRIRAERLSRLLQGVGPTRELGDSFGLAPHVPTTVVVVGKADGPAADSAASYAGDLLRAGLAAYRLRAAAGFHEGHAVAVVGAAADGPVLESIITTVLARATDQFGGEWRAGISRPLHDLSDVPAGLSQAQQALDVVCGSFGKGNIGRHDQLAASLFLLDTFQAMRFRPSLEGEPLSIVSDHDARHGTDYVRTLRCWIAAGYDIPRAAEALVLHSNSLRHRLRRLSEVIDLDDQDLRLALALQLRLQEISTKSDE